MPMKKGNKEKKVYFSPAEWEAVCKRSAELGMRTGTFIRKISVQGEIKVFDFKQLDNVYRAINRIGINLNQIATVVNSTGSVYQKDIEDMQKEFKEMSVIVEDWLSPFEPEVLQ